MTAHEAHGRGVAPRTVATFDKAMGLGDLATGSSDFRSAIQHYRNALAALGDSSGDARVSTLRKLSECLIHVGEFVEAQVAGQEAAHAIDETTSVRERARVALLRGRLAARTKDLESARAFADEAVLLLEDRSPCLELGRAFHQQGAIAYRAGDLSAAMQKYQTALETYKEIGDLGHVARAYRDIGLLHSKHCAWSRALESFQVAYSLMSTEGKTADLPRVSQSLGIVHAKMGNFQQATAHFETALKASREIGSSLGAARGLLGLGQVRVLERRFTNAESAFRDALEMSLPAQDFFGVALAYLGLADVALAAGAVEDARNHAEKADAFVVRLGKRSLEADLELINGRVALAEGDLSAAQTAIQTAHAACQRTGDRIEEARCLGFLADVEARQGRTERAEALLAQGADLLRRVNERCHLAAILERQASLNLASTDDRSVLKGQQLLLEALDCYRTLDLPEAQAVVLLTMAREDVRQRAVDRAIDRLEQVRRLQQSHTLPQLDGLVSEVYREVEQTFARNAASTRESFDAHRQMEGVLKSDAAFETKLIRFLDILTESVPCHGASVVRVVDANTIHVIGSRGIDAAAPGKAHPMPSGFRAADWPANERPLVFLGLEEANHAQALAPFSRDRLVSSAVAVPLREDRDGWSVLYVDRLADQGGAYFHQAEISHTLTLARQLAAFMEEASIRNQRGLRALRDAGRHLALADIVTQNAEMQGILGLVSRVADSDLTVLFQGETGTGKKLLARAIHECSPRAGKPFVTVDCAALPESVIEGELFGYVKGAFTGANSDRAGILEQADEGTVFLDEIDKAAIQVQRRFLHLLDVGEIRAVGGRAYRRLDLRVVCATSANDLRQEVEQGRFLKDLYFRLNDVNIVVPPLRRRKEDVPLLSDYFTDIFSQEMKKDIAGISQMAMRRLVDFEWPGNVRELEKVIRRAVTLADVGETIGLDLLPPRLVESGVTEVADAPIKDGESLKTQLERMEKQLVLRALEASGWNKSRAATALGLSRKGLKNKITRYGLDRRGQR